MKQTKLILLLPVIELLSVMVPHQNILYLSYYYIAQLGVAFWSAYLGMKQSMALLLTIWFTWLLATNHLPVILEYAAIEAGMLMVLVCWIYKRPEWIPSDPPSNDTVQLAFYYGDKSPFIAKGMALLGLNVTGIAVIIGDVAMVPVCKSGRIEKRTRKGLKKWIKLDTRFHGDSIIGYDSFLGLEGKEVKPEGCMKVFEDILIKCVPDWSLLDSPSSLMSKILANKK